MSWSIWGPVVTYSSSASSMLLPTASVETRTGAAALALEMLQRNECCRFVADIVPS
jgi:hypothetical protein